jgi:lysozyme family protein
MYSFIDDIIKREGGYVNHPSDRGGPTKFGITQKTLSAHRGVPCSIADVENLSRNEAAEIYEKSYVKPFTVLSGVPDRLLGLLVDCAVNHGVSRAVKFLQELLGVQADGVLGPGSLAAWRVYSTRACSMDDAYFGVLKARIRFYGQLITRDPSQAVFAAGWMNRVTEFLP